MQEFDLVVIGGGPAGYVAAIRAAQLGRKVALVEENRQLGGTCLRVGCIPSKALLESSHRYQMLGDDLARHGIRVADSSVDVEVLMERKRQVVDTLAQGVQALMKKNSVEVCRARGRLAGGGRVELLQGGKVVDTVSAAATLLAAGSLPVALPHLPFDGQRLVSSTGALGFSRVPEHLLVVGGGAVGLELGQVWCNLGARVTVVEMLPQIVPFADRLAARLLARSLKSRGMEIMTGCKLTGVEPGGAAVRATVEDGKGRRHEIECDRILVAVGRRPRTAGLGLESAGVELDDAGRVRVDEKLRTSAPGIFAAGDLVAGPMLAHKAHEDGLAAAENTAGGDVSVDYRLVPSVVYTHPELAQVGLTSQQCKQQGIKVSSGRFYFQASGRALAAGDSDGAVQVLAERDSGRIVGIHMVGHQVSELAGVAVVAMTAGMTAEQLGNGCQAHPSFAEALREAALAAAGRPLHA